MSDFLKFFAEKVRYYPMHMEIYYSKITDWSIHIWRRSNDGGDEEIVFAQGVDAELVKHGHWVEMERGHYFKCSKCRNPIPYKFGWKLYNGVIFNKRYYNYCPNCGAKMDEEVSE